MSFQTIKPTNVTRSGTNGTTFSAATSTDGTTWTPISGSGVSLPNLSGTLLAGVAMTSHDAGATSSATLLHTSASWSGATTTFPSPWETQQTSYNDAGQPTSRTYTDGEVLSLGYDGYGRLTSAITTPHGGSAINLLTGISYSGLAGAAGLPTSASVGNGTYSYSASYDNVLRPVTTSLALSSSNATLYSGSRSYDAVGNVTNVNTALPGGVTDNQAFCYDEQNRLTWAGSTGTPTCSVALTAGTLTGQSAQYTQSFAYDTQDRLTSITTDSSTTSSYTYGDPTHQDAATSTSGGYTASYDAAGDMRCRAPSSASTCTGSPPTGAEMSYDAERRLATWSSPAGATPVTTALYLYDGSGERVEQRVSTVAGGGTNTLYVGGGGAEEYTTNWSTNSSSHTTYYSVLAGLPTALSVNGVYSYLATDGLGSVSEALDASGNVTATQLYAPYGGVRYSSGTMPTAKGFTGQREDAAGGLDYYGARYYDPALGQFTSGDSDPKGGVNRYAYVQGRVETATDPTGHTQCPAGDTECGSQHGHKPGDGGGNGNGNGSNDSGAHSNAVSCRASAAVCQQINGTFSDPRTQVLLFLLTASSLGLDFLDYLLAVGADMGGDGYIVWDLTNPQQGGYTDFSGVIHLNASILGDYSTATLIGAAGVLVHEAVESFYAIADGVKSDASQHMDYVAEWFAGAAKSQLAAAYVISSQDVPGGSAYRQSFNMWIHSDDGMLYQQSEPLSQPEATSWWGGFWSNFAGDHNEPDGMGLTMGMLTASTLPN